jgi:chorismate synthase
MSMQKEKGNKEIVNCTMKPFIAVHKLQATVTSKKEKFVHLHMVDMDTTISSNAVLPSLIQ